MKRRGLTRVVALATVVSMMSMDLSAYATQTSTGNDTTTTTKSDATSEATSTDAKEEDVDVSAVVNERLEQNYAVVSAKYKYPEYTGKTITYSAEDTFDAEASTAELITNKKDTYGYDSSAVELGLATEDEEDRTVAVFKLDVEKAGVYAVAFDYLTSDEESILVPELSFELNGEVPFYECNRLIYENYWTPAIDPETGKEVVEKDRYDNEIVPSPEKVMEWQKKYIMDASYRYSTPLLMQLEKGENIIKLTLTESEMMVGNIYLEAAESSVGEVKTSTTAAGNQILVAQGENSTYRNDSSIRPTCEYDPDLYPYNAKKKTLNIIDSASFADAGQSLTYSFEVKEAGYYYLAFNYRQSAKVDMPVFMNIVIDQKIFLSDDEDAAMTNDRLTSYPFDYTKSFENAAITDEDGNKMAIYFEAGTHTVTTTISNDNVRETLQVIDEIMSEINDLSLEISKVANNADKYRDIKIKEYVPDIEERLAGWIEELNTQYARLAVFSTEEDDIGALSSLNLALEKLESLAEEPNKIPYRYKELCTSSSSVNQYLANLITDLTANGISFDRVYLYQDDAELPGKSSIFDKIWGAILRFLASFDSQAYSVDNADDTHLQVWINRPRQYLEIIQQMIDTTFTAETGIQVDLSIMPDAQKLILSNAAGNAPDVAQAVDYALPIEFALRDAAVDLTQFDGAKEVLEQFSPGLLVPSTMDGGIYSLPETFYFWVLFYRSDILEKLNIEVPDTMEEVEQLLPELKNRGLDFFYPTAGTTGTRVFAMTTPLLYQHGASLYGETAGDTTLDSDEGIAGFTELTELFTIYDIHPEITSFYQHFRNGDMPIGVSDYFMYSMLINAAPEIENSWKISLVPGVEDESGEVQRQTAGAAQSSMILKTGRDSKVACKEGYGNSEGGYMDRQEAAWEYLKWWMSTETQVDFGITLQTTYGEDFIWNSANTEAFSQLPWKSRDKQTILEQMEWIQETPRIPGTYMLERELSNAYVAVVTDGGILRTELDAAIKRIDQETERKLKEFGYLDSDGNVVKEYAVPSVEYVKEIISNLD